MYPCLSLPPISFPSVSGAVCSFDSQYAGLPLKSHTVDVNAVQSGSGTPSPDNVRNINGYSDIHIQNTCGVNQWDEVWRKGYYDSNNQGAFVANNSYICNTKDIRVEPNTSYYWFIGIPESYLQGRVLFFTADKQYISATEATAVNSVITTPNNCSYIRFYYYADGADYNNNCSINYPSTDTSYHAFVGQSVTIQIGSTIYGGNYDAVSGVLSVTWVKCQFGDLTWYKTSNFFRAEANLPLINGTNSKSNGYALANPYASQEDNIYLIFVQGGANQLSVLVRDLRYSDANTFKSAMENQDIYAIYELATPQTIQLVPCRVETQGGVNNVFADTGDTTLQYIKLD